MNARGVIAVVLAIAFGVAGWKLLGGAAGDGPKVPVRASTASRPGEPGEAMNPANAVAKVAFLRADAEGAVEGRPARWPSLHLAADRSEATASGEIAVDGVTFLSQPRPKSIAELSTVVRVDDGLRAEAAVAEVRKAFGRVPGFRAGRAVLHTRGTARKLTDVAGMSLTGGVRLWLVDPSDPGEDLMLDCEEAEVTCDGGEPVRFETPARVVLSRPRANDAVVSGVGLVLDLREGTMTLERDVAIDLKALVRGKPLAEPLTLTAGGPLVIAPDRSGAASKPKDAPRVFRLSSGTARIAGGVTLKQGAATARSARATLQLAKGKAAASTATLEGDVSYDNGDWSAKSDRLLIEPTPLGTRATLEPGPKGTVELRITAGGSFIPRTTKGGGDLVVSTRGTVTAFPVAKSPDIGDVPATRIHELRAGPDVVMTAGGDRLKAREVRLWIGDLPYEALPIAGASGALRKRQPFRAYASAAEGETDGWFLRASEWFVRRSFDRNGDPLEDRLTFKGDYDVVMKDVSTAKVDPAAIPGGAKPAATLKPAKGDRLVLAGPGTLEVVRTPFDNGPTTFAATGNVTAKLEAPMSAKPKVQLEATSMEALITPIVVGNGDAVVHRLETISAEKNVHLIVDGGVRARGGRLKYDPSIDELELAGSGRTERARIEITPESGVPQSVRAASMVWQGQVARLLATGNVEGDLLLARLPWADGTGATLPVASTVTCEKVSVLLDPAKVKSTGFEPLSIHAEGRVSMRQPDRTLTCGVFDYDPRTRSGSISGRPVTYSVDRVLGKGVGKDLITTDILVFDKGEAVARGPVQGVYHADRRRTALRIGRSATATPSSEELVPIRLLCRGNVVVAPNRLTLDDRVELTSGDPKGDGYHVEADHVLFEFENDSAGADVAFAVLSGDVIYVSKELEGRGDIMVLDRLRKQASLKADGRMKTGVYLRLGASTQTARVTEQGSRLDIDFSNPDALSVTSWDGRGRLEPDSRRSSR